MSATGRRNMADQVICSIYQVLFPDVLRPEGLRPFSHA